MYDYGSSTLLDIVLIFKGVILVFCKGIPVCFYRHNGVDSLTGIFIHGFIKCYVAALDFVVRYTKRLVLKNLCTVIFTVYFYLNGTFTLVYYGHIIVAVSALCSLFEGLAADFYCYAGLRLRAVNIITVDCDGHRVPGGHADFYRSFIVSHTGDGCCSAAHIEVFLPLNRIIASFLTYARKVCYINTVGRE